ncbi:hypothetical protein [Vallitalea okinawensis]|uniref:hypothetical protein n=1 Tax=Vallitalea okinawensis TaxID=2078660 RepID=UPI000CFCB476|nr:hypothetical protein [Vallitalea okinawensis]
MGTLTTKIAVLGSNYDDFIHYLTRVLFHMNLRISVIDCSDEQLLEYTLPCSDKESFFTYRGIDFILDKRNLLLVRELDLSSYDYCFYIVGVNEKFLGVLNNFDNILMITSIFIENFHKLSSFTKRIEANPPLRAVRIFRDYVNTKINRYYFQRELDTAQIEIVEEYLLYLSEDIHKYHIECQYNDQFNFRFIDHNMKKALLEVLYYLTGTNEKSIMKAYKIAGRGK